MREWYVKWFFFLCEKSLGVVFGSELLRALDVVQVYEWELAFGHATKSAK